MENLENEIWLPIKDFEGLYEISNLGRVKALKKKRSNGKEYEETIHKLTLSKWGYYKITLWKDNKRFYYLVHRLVACVFISNPENKPQVNHIDGIKSNNHIDNLEWCTQSENGFHAYKTGLSKPILGANHHAVKINENIARNVKKLLETRINNKPSLRQIAKDLGISRSCVREIHENKSWKYVKI